MLSLFFIDRVDNYTAEDGIIRRLFNENFEQLKQNYDHFTKFSPKDVQSAYFAVRRVKTDSGDVQSPLTRKVSIKPKEKPKRKHSD